MVRPARRCRRRGATCGCIDDRGLDPGVVVSSRWSGRRDVEARRGGRGWGDAFGHVDGCGRDRQDPSGPGRRRGRRPAGAVDVVGAVVGCRRVEVRARRCRRRPRRRRGHRRGDRHPIGRRGGVVGGGQPRAPRWRRWRAHRTVAAGSRGDGAGDQPGTDRANRRAGVAGSAVGGAGGRRGRRRGAPVGVLGRAARRPCPARHASVRVDLAHRGGGRRGVSPSRRVAARLGARRRQLASARGPWRARRGQRRSARCARPAGRPIRRAQFAAQRPGCQLWPARRRATGRPSRPVGVPWRLDDRGGDRSGRPGTAARPPRPVGGAGPGGDPRRRNGPALRRCCRRSRPSPPLTPTRRESPTRQLRAMPTTSAGGSQK